MKREVIVQAERELDAVLELIQESEGISGRDDIKEERMKERNRIQEAEVEESLTRINMEDTADMLQYEACRELKRCRDVHILRPGDSLLAAFFVPVLVLVVIFAQRGIFPFGEECFLRTDMYHQYAPFFSEFQYKLTHGGSLLYSWDIGMGVNFSALYAYYLASPMNWLVALCPRQFLIEFMTVLIVIKTGLSGLFFTWYLRKHTGTREFGSCFFGIFMH